MKIIFIIDSLANSGTEKSILEICKHFSTKITPIVVHLHPPITLKKPFIDAGIEVITLNNKKGVFLFQLYRLITIINKIKPDWIISSLFKANILARIASVIIRQRLIGTFVSDSYNDLRLNKMGWKTRCGLNIFKLFDRFTSSIPIAYISNSISVKYSNCKYLNIPLNKATVIYRGRDKQIIKEWQLPKNTPNKFIFIVIARVLETKGYKELLEAFYDLKQSHQNIGLKIYGDGNYSDTIMKYCKENGLNDCVSLYGNIQDAWQFLNEANCFIFPSWYEGVSGALIEAAISGIPIIASDIPMNKEVIEGLSNSLTHSVKDKMSIKNAMQKMMQNYATYSSLSSQTRDIAIEKFDIKMIAQQYETFLFEINKNK